MVSLSRQILAEKENAEIALRNLKEALSRKEKSVVELAAIGTFLHNVWNKFMSEIERFLKPQ